MMSEKHNNWAGNLTYGAERLLRPATLDELQEMVRRGRKLKALGTRHAFNDIADCGGDLVSLERFDRVLAPDPARRSVTLEGGVTYGRLCKELHRAGFGLHNLASLPHISVAGACATATHGSGDGNGNLATAVTALEVVRADGELVSLSRAENTEAFYAAVVGLGAFGVVARLTLEIVPDYEVRQDVYENLSLATLERHFDEILSAGYSVSLFTDWRGAGFGQVWLKRRTRPEAALQAEPEFFGAALARGPLHPIPGVSAENCTTQMGISGPWHERLPHFRMEFTPSSGEELQTEYLVPRPQALQALRAVDEIRAQIAPLLQISEVRSVAGDDLWMSPSYRQDSVAIHFTWKRDWPAVSRLLPAIEERLAPCFARPHWGKLFTVPPDRLGTLYEKLPDFRQQAQSFDPEGKFRNSFLDRNIFGEG